MFSPNKCTIPEDRIVFPDDGWLDEFKSIVLDPNCNDVPADWQERICTRFHWPKFDAACKTLKRMQDEERTDRLAEIEMQARSYEDAIWPVQNIIGSCDLPYPRVLTKRLVYRLMVVTVGVVFFVKRKAKRRRPMTVCRNVRLDPMFPPGSPFYPGHPSYPSGHAASAYALAYLYTHMFPKHPDRMMLECKAYEVAHNREIAGVHFPADSEAGKLVAKQVVDWFVKASKPKAAIDAARKEWPARWG